MRAVEINDHWLSLQNTPYWFLDWEMFLSWLDWLCPNSLLLLHSQYIHNVWNTVSPNCISVLFTGLKEDIWMPPSVNPFTETALEVIIYNRLSNVVCAYLTHHLLPAYFSISFINWHLYIIWLFLYIVDVNIFMLYLRLLIVLSCPLSTFCNTVWHLKLLIKCGLT